MKFLDSYFKNASVLVTGGAGFIGSHLCKKLKELGAEVIAFDNLSYAADVSNLVMSDMTSVACTLYPLDICSEIASNMVKQLDPDFIFHLAAETHVDRSIENGLNFVKTDTLGTANLLEACRDLKNLKAFVYVSTDEVYGSVYHPVEEDFVFNPSSPYSASKAGADHLALSYVKTHGLPISIARPCNALGPNQFPEKLIPKLICNGLTGKTMPIYGDGQQKREWIYVEDLVDALLTIARIGRKGEAYNVTSGQSKTNLSIAHDICEWLDLDPEVTIEYVEDRLGHDLRYCMSSRKITEELGWSPKVNIVDAEVKTIEWYTINQWWWENKV